LAQNNKEPSLIAAGLFGLSQAEQRLDHFDGAMESIDRAIAAAEDLRSNIVQDSVRVSFFATAQELFDQAILLALARGRQNLALHYSERAHARALRDVLTNTTVKDLSTEQVALVNATVPNLQALQRSIPVFAQAVEYRLTPDTLLIWLIDRQKVMTRRVAISAKAIAQLVQMFLQSVGADGINAFKNRVADNLKAVSDENRQIGHRLYQLLWEPIADDVAPDKRLFIIPDGVLHRLPFGALVSDNERFFEEEYLYVKAPSLAILAENSTGQTSPSQHKQGRFVMIADDLPSVRGQKKQLSRLFVNSSFLVKQEATYEALQKRLRDGANIIYFSVHAQADERYPMNSYIELYSNAGTKCV
jgi:CHAT domain-containing protein